MGVIHWHEYRSYANAARDLSITTGGVYSAVRRGSLQVALGDRPAHWYFHPDEIERYGKLRRIPWQRRKDTVMRRHGV